MIRYYTYTAGNTAVTLFALGKVQYDRHVQSQLYVQVNGEYR